MADLEARIQAIEGHGLHHLRTCRSGLGELGELDELDENGGTGLPGSPPVLRGVVHEWFGVVGAETRSPWIPPMGVLFQLAQQGLRQAPGGADRGSVLWIGRRVWPYLVPGGREGDAELLARSVFVDPPDDASRLWAIDQAVRCEAVTVVVADGSGIDLARSRRLQLAAESSAAVILLARPPSELDTLSAASMRWTVSAAPSTGKTPRWTVELTRCKAMVPGGARNTEEEAPILRLPGGNVSMGRRRWTSWIMEWKRVPSGDFAVPAALHQRPGAAPAQDQDRASRRTA